MTGRKSNRKRVAKQQQPIPQTSQQQQPQTQPHPQQQQRQIQSTNQLIDDNLGSPPPNNIRKEQPPPPQIVKKILKAESEEASTLKTVFKSNPDAQMKEFIKKAVTKPTQHVTKVAVKTPADTHPPAVAQELLETDDDVADNLAKLFKTSKSYKNIP